MSYDAALNDSAITRPEQDRYSFDPFARALARGVAGMAAPEGMVLAVTGPWGSGKSGVVNLVMHHLRPEIDAERLQMVRFSPWWFDGREALARGFFEALQAALGDTLRKKAKKVATEAVNAIYQRVKPVKPFLAIGGNVATGVPAGTATAAVVDLALDKLNTKRPVEREYERLAKVLRDQPRRFLVVIDDIDRLDADDATLVFRLVKSVGRLPNVIYMLAFDRAVADQHLGQRFGEAASRYLEKIVQVSYELPIPARPLLLQALLAELDGVLSLPEGAGRTRFGNLLHDCVAPWLDTPRDVVLLANAVRVGWPAVAGDTDPADFLALEAIKLAHPDTYRAVQANPQALCGVERLSGTGHRLQEESVAQHDAMLLASVPNDGRNAMRTALRRLFPRLDSVWANLWHDPLSAERWRRDRLVCSRQNFDTYFLLAPGEGVVPAAELAQLLAKLGSPEYVRAAFLGALTVRRRMDSVSRAALLLEELRLAAADVALEVIPGLLATLSGIADDLDVPEDDQLPGWGNQLRLWWLIDDLTRGRLDQKQRSTLLVDLARVAQLHWLSWMADIAGDEHKPVGEGKPERYKEPMVTLECADALRAASLDAIRQAARVGTLLRHQKLRQLLFAWAERAGDDGAQVRRWTDGLLDEDGAVVRLAETLTFLGESFGLGGNGFLGDRVATKLPQVDRTALAKVCDPERLTTRVTELLERSPPDVDRIILKRFTEGLRRCRLPSSAEEP